MKNDFNKDWIFCHENGKKVKLTMMKILDKELRHKMPPSMVASFLFV